MEQSRFLNQLLHFNRIRADKFKIREAESFSRQIHKAEVDGYKLTNLEDSLWHKLTLRIEGIRKSNHL